MTEISDLYYQFERRWELSHPKPEPNKVDSLLYILQLSVAAGAVLLSGSRTGNAVSEIGSLTEFGIRLVSLAGFGEEFSALFLAAEAILAFITFDAAILLAGYLTGDDDASPFWYWVLLIVALVPALGANVLPGVSLLGWADVGRVIVDVLIGVCSPLMAFVSGRVIGVTRRKYAKQVSDLTLSWEEAKAKSWTNSSEYRRRNRVDEKPHVKESELSDQIVAYLDNRGSIELSDLSVALGADKSSLISEIFRLQKAGYVERNGSKVWVPDF